MWHSPFSAFITRLTFYIFFPSESSTRSINFYWGLYKHLSELEVFKATYHLDVVLACIILLLFPLRSHTLFKLQLKSLTNNCPALWLRKGKGKDCFGQIWGVIWFCLLVCFLKFLSQERKSWFHSEWKEARNPSYSISFCPRTPFCSATPCSKR